MVSKGQFVGLDWNCIARLHSQVMNGTCELTNSIALSHLISCCFYNIQFYCSTNFTLGNISIT